MKGVFFQTPFKVYLGLKVTFLLSKVHPGYGFLSENKEFAKRLVSYAVNYFSLSTKSVRSLMVLCLVARQQKVWHSLAQTPMLSRRWGIKLKAS